MRFFPIIVLGTLSLSAPLRAEHQQASIKVYSNQSRLNVEKLNSTAEILRDPTQMNESFRDALKRMSPAPRSGAKGAYQRPEISLSALVAGPDQTYAAMLKIDDEIRLVKAGDRLSVVSHNDLLDIAVEEVSGDEIRLTVYPPNETITLR